jgi:predicted phage terminase large subunit-like protein
VEWSVVIRKAIQDDGTLFFPERLTKEFLEDARRTLGSYFFANQYLNIIVPDEEKKFRKEWLKYSTVIPKQTYSFGFIDPAIGQKKHNDYTATSIIQVDCEKIWYYRLAIRERLTPTQIVSKCFDLCKQFKLQALGIEQVAFQEALLYMLSEEMGKPGRAMIPVKGITRNDVSKHARILGLVPRFEWNRILCFPGMTDFEDELESFPRGSHDDILDSLASLEELVYYPEKEKEIEILEQPHSAHDPTYERWNIQQLIQKANSENSDGDSS